MFTFLEEISFLLPSSWVKGLLPSSWVKMIQILLGIEVGRKNDRFSKQNIFIFTLSLLTVFLTFIQTSVLKDNCHILDACSSRRMQSGEDPRWFWAFPSRRKDLSTLPEDGWWVLDIVRCSVWAGTGSVLWDEPAGWTLQCVPLGSDLYHDYSQVRKHYICQSLVFLKFGFPDLTHDSDKRNSGCSDGHFTGLGLVVTQSQFALVWGCRTFLLLWTEWVGVASVECLWSWASLVLKKTLHYTSQWHCCVPWSKVSHLIKCWSLRKLLQYKKT